MSEEIVRSQEMLSDISVAVLPDIPEALRVPTRNVGWGFLVALTLGNMGWLLVGNPILSLILPAQVSKLDSIHKVTLLGIVLTLGSLMGAITPPLSGALSDRTTSRMGRRRPWMLGGVVGIVVGLLLAALLPSIPVLILSWVVLGGAGNLLLAMMTFVMPDRIPEQQRGTASAIVSLAAPIGSVVGLLMVTTILNLTGQSFTVAYLVLIVFAVVFGGGFVLFYREPQLPKEAVQAFQLDTFLKGFWVNPLSYPNFAYAWVTRFLMFLAFFTASSFVYFYLSDVIHYTQLFPGQSIAEGVTIVSGILTVCSIASALIGGFLSDHFQRRKVFVIAASIIIGLGLLCLGLVHTWLAVLVAIALVGVGFGAYGTADMALIIQVLPDPEASGQHLGVMVIALNLAQFAAPTIGAVVISIFATHVVAGYSTLYILSAVLTLLSAVLVLRIKGVR